MNIVMFTDAYWPRVNGISVSVESFSRALVRLGHRVMIVCSVYPESLLEEFKFFTGEVENKGPEEPVILRAPSMPLPLPISKEDRLAKTSGWFWVAKHIEAFNPDIVHIHTEFVIAEFGFNYAKLHYLPAVYTFHTMWEDYGFSYFPLAPGFLVRYIARRILKNALRRADLVIVPTPQIREVVKRYRVRKETVMLPTGIDPRQFDHSKEDIEAFGRRLEEKFPGLKAKRILLFAGRVAREKNISFLLKLLPSIREEHPDTVLLIVGNGPDLDSFKKEVEELELTDCCFFPGYLKRDELSLAYAVSDIFVFPSITETQGLVTIEAMLSGLPVVAIGEMGTIEVMNGDNGGFMVKNDPEQFREKVCMLLSDRELYEQKVLDARAHAKSWTIDTMAERLQGIYEKVLDAWPGKKNGS
ncbi:MAG: glycosyltransferase [Treponema sp.]|jgi:glycosyltransferase involved in cell wall biosynthesis|nr:glycosyltransferase [Treponema sp.]